MVPIERSAVVASAAVASDAPGAAPGVRTQRRLAAGSAAAAASGTALVAAADPSVPGRYGLCPLLAVTGWWCPLCGSLRAVHELAHGDVVAAVELNVLVVAALPLALYAWAAWAAPLFGLPGPPRWRPTRAAAVTLAVVAVVALAAFGVARNLAALAWLAPTAG